MKATIIHISAVPGQPSTLWMGESGKFYRTKAQAELDNGIGAIDPVTIQRNQQNFFTRHKLLCTSLMSALFAALIVYYIMKQ